MLVRVHVTLLDIRQVMVMINKYQKKAYCRKVARHKTALVIKEQGAGKLKKCVELQEGPITSVTIAPTLGITIEWCTVLGVRRMRLHTMVKAVMLVSKQHGLLCYTKIKSARHSNQINKDDRTRGELMHASNDVQQGQQMIQQLQKQFYLIREEGKVKTHGRGIATRQRAC
jgi:hypothetical protein